MNRANENLKQVTEQNIEISPSGLMDLENAAKYLNVKPDSEDTLARKRKSATRARKSLPPDREAS